MSFRRAEGEEESAIFLAFCEKQIPRCARNDPQERFFNKLLSVYPTYRNPFDLIFALAKN